MSGNKELIDALNEIEKEKDISKDILLEAIENSLLAACKNQFGRTDNIKVNINRENGAVNVYAEKTIVDEVEDDLVEITLDEAKQKFPRKKLAVGDVVNIEVTPKNFLRISAQKAKQAVVQKIREEERKVIYNQFTAETLQSILERLMQSFLRASRYLQSISSLMTGSRYMLSK